MFQESLCYKIIMQTITLNNKSRLQTLSPCCVYQNHCDSKKALCQQLITPEIVLFEGKTCCASTVSNAILTARYFTRKSYSQIYQTMTAADHCQSIYKFKSDFLLKQNLNEACVKNDGLQPMISQSEIHYRDTFFSSLSTLLFKPYEQHLSHSIVLSTQHNHGEDS